MALHVNDPFTGKNCIAICTSTDGVIWTGPLIVLRPTPGAWDHDGRETPSLHAPTPQLPVWSLMSCGYPTVPEWSWTREGRYSSIGMHFSAGLFGPYTEVGAGPVIGPTHGWTLPYRGQAGKLAGGVQEPTHLVLGGVIVALFATNSYRPEPAIGQATSFLPWLGTSFTVAPQPVLAESGPGWASQPDLWRGANGLFHVVYAIGSPNEEVWHAQSADLLSWPASMRERVVQRAPGYATRAFGACAVELPGTPLTRLWWTGVDDPAGKVPWSVWTALAS